MDAKGFARKLRRDSTDIEKKFWALLRDRRFQNFKFRRQQIMGKYVVDFVCHERTLIIELDGGQHAEREAHDQLRTQFLESQGYQVLRFWDNDALRNQDGVLETILGVLEKRPKKIKT